MKKAALSLVVIALLSACVGIPDNLTPASNFELQRYLGKWYEIARLTTALNEA